MTKNKNVIIVSGLIILIAAVGIIFATQRDKSIQNETTPMKNCTTYNGAIEEQCAEDYIGLTKEAATEKAEKAGLVPKINRIDGEIQMNTLEGSTPIYFEIENDIVTKAYFEDDIPAFEGGN